MLKLVETVQTIYAAFGRGDVPAILEHLHEDVDWEYVDVGRGQVPWLRPGRGRPAALAFFQAVGTGLTITKFVPKTFLEGPGVIAVLVDIDFTVNQTGKQVREIDEVHLWHFDDRGRVVRFRHVVDSAQHIAAAT